MWAVSDKVQSHYATQQFRKYAVRCPLVPANVYTAQANLIVQLVSDKIARLFTADRY
jgi:hypothetical protein